jgi:hypothetical protein
MQSSLIGKIEKAKTYASERERMHVDQLHVTFRGNNGEHEVSIQAGQWHCTCDFFGTWQVCSHTMAIERVMRGMVPPLPLPESQAASA